VLGGCSGTGLVTIARRRRREGGQRFSLWAALLPGALVGVLFLASTVSLVDPVTLEGSSPGLSAFSIVHPPKGVKHVIVLFLENENLSTVLQYGENESSYWNTYAGASQFYGLTDSSQNDYVAATSGTFTSTSPDTDPAPNLADRIQHKYGGPSWMGFMESMPSACDLKSSSSVPYSNQHNPWIFYTDIVSNSTDPTRCTDHDVSLSNASNLGGPVYSFVSPNKYDDGDSLTPVNKSLSRCTATPTDTLKCEVQQADAWLQGWLSGVLGETFFDHSVVLIVYDSSWKGDKTFAPPGGKGGHVYMVAVGPSSIVRDSFHSPLPYNTYSLLTTVEWLLGLGQNKLHHDNWAKYWPLYALFNTSKLYDLNITVKNSTDGKIIQDATIKNSVANITQTDVKGVYLVPDLANGTYILYVTAPGCSQLEKKITIDGGNKAISVKLTC
jgi:hypothetical protein